MPGSRAGDDQQRGPSFPRKRGLDFNFCALRATQYRAGDKPPRYVAVQSGGRASTLRRSPERGTSFHVASQSRAGDKPPRYVASQSRAGDKPPRYVSVISRVFNGIAELSTSLGLHSFTRLTILLGYEATLLRRTRSRQIASMYTLLSVATEAP